MKYTLLFTACTFCFTCQNRPETPEINTDCACKIEKIVDLEGQKDSSLAIQSESINPEINLDTNIKKVVDAKVKLSGIYSNSTSKIQEVYWKILGDNPGITQKINLFRIVACAYYEIICQDTTLKGIEKRKELTKIVDEYKNNVENIIYQKPPKTKKIISQNSASNELFDPTKRKGSPQPPRTDDNKQSENTKNNCEAEVEYFLHKEILYKGKLITYKWYIDLYKESIEKWGVKFLGPTCRKRNENFIISYHVVGMTNDGKIMDHFADFKVNSEKEEIVPLSALAKNMLGVITPQKEKQIIQFD